MKKIVVLLLLTGALASCGAYIGTPSAVRETGRLLNGLTVPKSTTVSDPYHDTQKNHDNQAALRIRLAGGGES